MTIIALFILIIFSAIVLIPFVNVHRKGMIAVLAVIGVAILSGIIAFRALAGTDSEYLFRGSLVTGKIPVRIDALSGLFILIINFTFITGAIYGLQYMKAYKEQRSNLSLHCISFILCQSSLLRICSLQNTIAFLTAWEIMHLYSFILIIFEHNKRETLYSEINFLTHSHICIMFLTLVFIWVALKKKRGQSHYFPGGKKCNSVLKRTNT